VELSDQPTTHQPLLYPRIFSRFVCYPVASQVPRRAQHPGHDEDRGAAARGADEGRLHRQGAELSGMHGILAQWYSLPRPVSQVVAKHGRSPRPPGTDQSVRCGVARCDAMRYRFQATLGGALHVLVRAGEPRHIFGTMKMMHESRTCQQGHSVREEGSFSFYPAG